MFGRESRGALTEQEYLAGALMKLKRAKEALANDRDGDACLAKDAGLQP